MLASLPQAIDSRARGGEPIPDPELHTTSIADAIAAGHPALVVFSTPVYCVSRFCGPVTDLVAELAAEYGDRADFIHVEIYRDFEAGGSTRPRSTGCRRPTATSASRGRS